MIFLHEGKVLLKEETDSLLERAVHISGREEDVDAVCEDRKVHHVEKLGRSKGVTVLFVSHSLKQVKRICNKAMILDHGTLLEIGDIGPVSDKYQGMLDA